MSEYHPNPSRRANELRKQGMTGAYMEGTNPDNVLELPEGGGHSLTSGEVPYSPKGSAEKAAEFINKAVDEAEKGEQ